MFFGNTFQMINIIISYLINVYKTGQTRTSDRGDMCTQNSGKETVWKVATWNNKMEIRGQD